MPIGALTIPVSADIGGLSNKLQQAKSEIKGWGRDVKSYGKSLKTLEGLGIGGVAGSIVGGGIGGLIGKGLGKAAELSGVSEQLSREFEPIQDAFRQKLGLKTRKELEGVKEYNKTIDEMFFKKDVGELGEEEALRNKRIRQKWTPEMIENEAAGNRILKRQEEQAHSEELATQKRAEKGMALGGLEREAALAGLDHNERRLAELREKHGLSDKEVDKARDAMQRADTVRQEAHLRDTLLHEKAMDLLPGGGDFNKMFGDQMSPARNALADRIQQEWDRGGYYGPTAAMRKDSAAEFSNLNKLRRAMAQLDKPDPTPEEIRKMADRLREDDAKREKQLEDIKAALKDPPLKQAQF
jgi:hypothetical protein